ncbi:ATP-dependent Clp protease adaptor ClpS [Spirosoma luteum]|jgi:ATP-dependent Clp protease adaptor protein ClpS|uniref:ATP-dependent Clp protease adaptor ClpS n=1 Tax=Spirosoma luteum TaxID=431553 RepID=UPI0003764304|nr:ATP-dependent Clp protease adaptor ClpS [Spirosoma luteum]
MQPFEENDWSTNVDVLDEVVETDVHNLVVFNDDVNSFDHVIATLIDVCAHTPEQAEQCTLLIHYKGKCSVKNGSWDELVPMRNEICRRGINAEVLN